MKDMLVINLPGGAACNMLDLPNQHFQVLASSTPAELSRCLIDGEVLEDVIERIEIEKIRRVRGW